MDQQHQQGAEAFAGGVYLTSAFLGGSFVKRVGALCGPEMQIGLILRIADFCETAGLNLVTDEIEIRARYMIRTGFLVFTIWRGNVSTFWHDGVVYDARFVQRLLIQARLNGSRERHQRRLRPPRIDGTPNADKDKPDQ